MITSEYLTLKRKAIKYSNSGNAYFFVNLRNILNLHNSLIKNNCIDSNNITNTQLEIIKNIINSSNLSNQIKNNKSKYHDNYNSWIVLSDIFGIQLMTMYMKLMV